MRQIKFRGQISHALANGGQWVYWGVSGTDMIDSIDPDTIGQFTGLKDKNGVEIYESDIVQHEDGYIGDVIYWQTKCSFSIASNDEVHDYFDDFDMYDMKFTVIGNIYQNKELLE